MRWALSAPTAGETRQRCCLRAAGLQTDTVAIPTQVAVAGIEAEILAVILALPAAPATAAAGAIREFDAHARALPTLLTVARVHSVVLTVILALAATTPRASRAAAAARTARSATAATARPSGDHLIDPRLLRRQRREADLVHVGAIVGRARKRTVHDRQQFTGRVDERPAAVAVTEPAV